jgi:WD40 repeat protein
LLSTLLCALQDKSIIVWKHCRGSKESEDEKKAWVKCAIGTGHTGSVNSLACSRAVEGGKCWLASASEDTTVKLWRMGQVNTSKSSFLQLKIEKLALVFGKTVAKRTNG